MQEKGMDYETRENFLDHMFGSNPEKQKKDQSIEEKLDEIIKLLKKNGN